MLGNIKGKLLFQYYRFLWWCARRYLQRHQIFTIGINGSVGKTSCRMIIYQTLKKALPELNIYTSPKNFNGELGMSLSIFQVEEWVPSVWNMIKAGSQIFCKALFGKKAYDMIVLEYGIDRPKEMEFLLSINKPNIGVFTAIDAVHSEQFGSPADIAEEEVKMVKNTREAVFLNRDDAYAKQVCDRIGVDVLTYTTSWMAGVDLSFENETIEEKQGEKSEFLISFDAQIKDKHYAVQTNLIWKPNYAYLTLGLAIAQICVWKFTGEELNMEEFLSDPLIYQLQPGRCSIFAGEEWSLIVDSTYNSSPLSMRKLIDTTLQIQKSLRERRKVMLVLGDMRELGDLTEQEHRLLAWYVHQSADQICLVGESMDKYLLDELEKTWVEKSTVKTEKNSQKLWMWIVDFLKRSDEKWIILFKGSQNTIFLEEAVKQVLANKADVKYLTRQSDWWMQKKSYLYE